ncbi:MAG: hypothetical protein ABIS45_02125, partial [Burkholderiales bacterium]
MCSLVVLAACVFAVNPVRAAESPRADGREALTVDAFSVVKVIVKAVPDARSRNSLGGEREGTGIV